MSSTPSSSGIAVPKKHPETPDEGRAGRRRRQRLDRRGEGQVGGRRRAANSLPARGEAVRELGLALPPARMRLMRGGRTLKRWRYVGVYAPELMLCAAEALVGPLGQRFWAVVEPDGRLRRAAPASAPAGST